MLMYRVAALHAAGLHDPCVLLTKKDVTVLKIQRDAKLIEARFRDLLETTPDGAIVVGPTGHIVFANSHTERLFGYATGELRGRLVETLLPARYHSDHVAHRSGYFGQPRIRSMGVGLELFGLRKDERRVPGRDQPEPTADGGDRSRHGSDPRHQ